MMNRLNTQRTMSRASDVLKIRISGLSTGTHEYHFQSSPADLGLDGKFTKPVAVDVTLDKTSSEVFLQTQIRTVGSFECDRCVTDFEQEVSTEYRMVYLYREADSGRYPPEEIRTISHDMVSLDLTEDVRESILLAVPLKLLCKPDCRGLCPRCGTDWNIRACNCDVTTSDVDRSRWQGLDGLIQN
jgi:uncharacterized protein